MMRRVMVNMTYMAIGSRYPVTIRGEYRCKVITANEIHFICGGKCCQNRQQKMHQAIQMKNSRKAVTAKTGWIHKAPEKGAQ